MAPSEKVVEIVQRLTRRYPDSTAYIMVVVTLILILQLISFVRSF